MESRKRTIDMLVDVLQQDVWVYLKNPETCRQFYEDAEAEHYMFGDIKPTESHTSDIIVVHKDKTLGHPGTIGHMAFYNAMPGNKQIRVDYAKYIAGDDSFYIMGKEDLE